MDTRARTRTCCLEPRRKHFREHPTGITEPHWQGSFSRPRKPQNVGVYCNDLLYFVKATSFRRANRCRGMSRNGRSNKAGPHSYLLLHVAAWGRRTTQCSRHYCSLNLIDSLLLAEAWRSLLNRGAPKNPVDGPQVVPGESAFIYLILVWGGLAGLCKRMARPKFMFNPRESHDPGMFARRVDIIRPLHLLFLGKCRPLGQCCLQSLMEHMALAEQR